MMNYNRFAAAISREAGHILKNRYTQKHDITYKGDIDIVTETDHLSEQLLLSRITTTFPHHDILTEESCGIERGAEYRWIIDPLDGTTNYAHGFPFFCVSIALEHRGEIILGVIYDPMSDELYEAAPGKGAFLNGEPITVSGTETLSKSLLATGFPYDIRTNPDNNLNCFCKMTLQTQAIRRAGSAALDLAYVAAGRFDGFWELQLHPWDTAAGWLLVTEAGGSVTDFNGSHYSFQSRGILATNGKIHTSMKTVIETTDPLYKGLLL
jgi:myo-inositol-1(or 4)-monophosphatase